MQESLTNNETWLSLKDAAARLGVHPATVRRWADSGQIPFMRTPGGHRRFALSAIQQMIRQQQSPQRAALDAAWAERALVQTRSHIVEQRNQEWMSAYSETDRVQKRELGRRLMGLMLQFISAENGSPEILTEAEAIGRAYAEHALDLNLPLADVVQATQFFRDTIVTTALDLPENVQVKAADRRRLVTRVNTLLNAVQLAVAGVYDDHYGV